MRRRGLERPVPRGERGVSRKTIAQGMSECFGNTCSDYARLLFPFANEAAGAVERPAFPAPSAFSEGHRFAKPGQNPAARMPSHVSSAVVVRLAAFAEASAAE